MKTKQKHIWEGTYVVLFIFAIFLGAANVTAVVK
jgi:hypothetical protein